MKPGEAPQVSPGFFFAGPAGSAGEGVRLPPGPMWSPGKKGEAAAPPAASPGPRYLGATLIPKYSGGLPGCQDSQRRLP